MRITYSTYKFYFQHEISLSLPFPCIPLSSIYTTTAYTLLSFSLRAIGNAATYALGPPAGSLHRLAKGHLKHLLHFKSFDIHFLLLIFTCLLLTHILFIKAKSRQLHILIQLNYYFHFSYYYAAPAWFEPPQRYSAHIFVILSPCHCSFTFIFEAFLREECRIIYHFDFFLSLLKMAFHAAKTQY